VIFSILSFAFLNVLFLIKTKNGWNKSTITEIIIGVNKSNASSQANCVASFKPEPHHKKKTRTTAHRRPQLG
jgi:hypothetical protein